ncbi:MAG: hypothetical protein AAGA29_09775 [Planctomycetota bacterium]
MTLPAALFFRPPLGGAWTLALLALVVGIVLWQGLHGARWRWAIVPRLVSVALLGWVLLGPSTYEATGETDPALPGLVVLIDTSASMAQRDVLLPGQPSGGSRLDALRATWLSPNTLKRLDDEADVRLIAFDQQVWPTSSLRLEASGRATHLYDAAARYRDSTLVILSDGHDTRNAASTLMPPEPGAYSTAFAVPVGATSGAPDIALQAWAHSDRLFDGQSTPIEVQVYQRGFADQPATVELLHNGEVIESRGLVLDVPLQHVMFEVQPELPPRTPTQVHGYTCRVTLNNPDESYTTNNDENVYIQVTREKTRVLLVEGAPSWDTRSLSRLLGTHPGFDLSAVYALGERRRVTLRGEDAEGVDLLTAEELAGFDVVVLGRRVERLVDEMWASQLVRFVEQGGAVVFAKGRPIEPSTPAAQSMLDTLESISPARFGERVAHELQFTVSEAAKGNPLTTFGDDDVISRMPGMVAATRVRGQQAASVVLLEAAQGSADIAAVSTLRVGQGAALAVFSEGLWRWELLPNPLAQYESVYAVFWTRAMQWLASGGEFLPGQDVSLSLDRLTVEPGEPVEVEVRMRYAELGTLRPELRINKPDGSTAVVAASPNGAPGQHQARLTPEEPGIYRVALTVPDRPDLVAPEHPVVAYFSVVDRSPELRDTAARPEVLQALAESRGGRCLALDEVEPVIEHLRDIRAARASEDVAVYRFATWPVFGLIFAGLGIEWLIRRRGGLL